LFALFKALPKVCLFLLELFWDLSISLGIFCYLSNAGLVGNPVRRADFKRQKPI
jgi:hypothetical protein